MSFRFNAEVFKDNSFNENIKEKLTKALNSSTSSSSSPVVTRSETCGEAPYAGCSDAVPLGAATVTEQRTPQSRGSTTTTTTTTTISPKTRSTMSSKKLDILKSEIIVSKVNFPTMPELEILDLDISAQPRSLVKGICKISCRDAMLQIQTEIESNLLLVYSDYSPDFTTPTMICKDSFTIPITMVFSEIRLEAITNLFVKNSGIGISFNDVNLDFKFDCSIKILQSTIEKRLKKSMQMLFKEVLPSVIFNMSQTLFTAEETNRNVIEGSDKGDEERDCTKTVPLLKVMLEESDLELSPANMLRLSTLISSRQTLSLNATVLNVPSTIPGCLERQNLRRFNSRIPSLSNYYANFCEKKEKPADMKRSTSSLVSNYAFHEADQNILPAKVLEGNAYDLKTITSIQNRVFERSTDENVRPRRRKIKIAKSKKSSNHESLKDKDNTNREPSNASGEGETTEVDSPLSIQSEDPILTAPRPLKLIKPFSLMTAPCRSEFESRAYSPATLNSVSTLKLPVNLNPMYFSQTDKPSLNFEPQIVVSRANSPRKLNLLEETNYFNYRPELHKLRSTIYSPLGKNNAVLLSGKELSEQRQLFEKRRLSFVGLNYKGINWGSDDEPPPYII
ncbi:hypothetical protein HG535_0B02590 [Zygotorulaspora mrakii]|uniref:Mitochondrial distribution and morphology protein 34 n=1 Tax=Zygotorulaspora mrakii TaxID=42260 RepID=A0A7H9AXT0_ZYGMR|nr:uncharacterized protein HG535_0B02590 [Zygotorulaspora mrakii]QLG71220.1 hypothetical protein HG535_0B02590 [Zygotorulaspora mrakii]